ncbi:cytochrome c [Inquilinus sp. CAU 1745]|uniref:c-type cytochrome n=1 Tax=Inquilinus sp. CAU 1745 TaxID=3140369 RepID=UPI00325BFBCA
MSDYRVASEPFAPSRAIIGIAAGFVVAAVVGGAVAHEGATGVVAERMVVMEGIADHMKALGAMVSDIVPFDAEAAQTDAEHIHEGAKQAADLFPPGSHGHHTEALPAVWADRATFNDMMDRFAAESAALIDAANSGDRAWLAAQFKEVGAVCSGCHEAFRE